MLVVGLFFSIIFHLIMLSHQPPSSVLGNITRDLCLFGSPPDYESLILIFDAILIYLPRYVRCTSCSKLLFLKGACLGSERLCFDPSSRSRRPSFLPSMSTSSAIPPDFMPIGSASSGSSSPVGFPAPPVRGVRVRRVAALYWAASTCTSLF